MSVSILHCGKRGALTPPLAGSRSHPAPAALRLHALLSLCVSSCVGRTVGGYYIDLLLHCGARSQAVLGPLIPLVKCQFKQKCCTTYSNNIYVTFI